MGFRLAHRSGSPRGRGVASGDLAVDAESVPSLLLVWGLSYVVTPFMDRKSTGFTIGSAFLSLATLLWVITGATDDTRPPPGPPIPSKPS